MLYLPKPGDKLIDALAWEWYSNIPIEIADGFLDKDQQRYLSEYYIEAGLLRKWRQPFFRQHYAKTLAATVAFLFSHKQKPIILDLGCGTGTQSLLFALLGARVISLDMDDVALDILRLRHNFYEKATNRSLHMKIEQADVLTYDYAKIAPLDAVYSLFAFNMMQPNKNLIARIAPYMSQKSKIAVLDGNRSFWVSRYFHWRRRNTLSPEEFENEIKQYGFSISDHYGGVVFPPFLWCILPNALLHKIDMSLGAKSWLFPISHHMLADRA